MVAEHKKLCSATSTRAYGKQQLRQHCSCINDTLLEREPLNGHENYALLKCADGSLEESVPLGSGRPSIGHRYRNSAVFTWLFTSSHMAIFVALIRQYMYMYVG